jgi:hypothetical protein
MQMLSLMLEDEFLRVIENEALKNNIPVSVFVLNTLKNHLIDTWPKSFRDSYGSVTDASFNKPESPEFALDAHRESL